MIIGEDLQYRNGIVTGYAKRARTDKSLQGIKALARRNSVHSQKLADTFIKNTYRTLMTRGQKGCYLYCCDKNLAECLKRRLRQ